MEHDAAHPAWISCLSLTVVIQWDGQGRKLFWHCLLMVTWQPSQTSPGWADEKHPGRDSMPGRDLEGTSKMVNFWSILFRFSAKDFQGGGALSGQGSSSPPCCAPYFESNWNLVTLMAMNTGPLVCPEWNLEGNPSVLFPSFSNQS